MNCVQSSLRSCNSELRDGDALVLVGTGRVATQLGLALCRAGVAIRGVYGRNEKKASLLASRLASSVYAGVVDPTAALEQLPQGAVYLFCVADDSILPLAEQWDALAGTIIHTSGSVPLPRLPHSRTGVFYPLQTFSAERDVDLSQTHFFVEGSDEGVVDMLSAWARRLSHVEPVRLDSAQRQWLHLLGVLSNNFTNALLVEVQRMAVAHQLPFDALEPLLAETLTKAFALSPLAAQTGPARRGDEQTLARHRALLADTPSLRQLYDLFTALIQAQDAKP